MSTATVEAPFRPPARGRLRRMLAVVHTLAVAELKLKYLDATLSYFWGVARPLAFFGVLDFVFTHVGRFNHGVHHYALYLLTAIVLWTYFAESTASAVNCLIRRGEIVRKVPFPHIAIPLSVALTSLIDLAMNLVAVFAFLLAAGVSPRLTWLELPLLVLLLTMLVSGMGMLLSVLYVRYRDVDQIWLVVRQALFYATPVFYVAKALHGGPLEHLLVANPLAAIITEARRALIDPHAPTAAQEVGGAVWLLIPLGLIVASFVMGIVLYRRDRGRLAEIV